MIAAAAIGIYLAICGGLAMRQLALRDARDNA